MKLIQSWWIIYLLDRSSTRFLYLLVAMLLNLSQAGTCKDKMKPWMSYKKVNKSTQGKIKSLEKQNGSKKKLNKFILDFLSYMKTADKDICLVSPDFSGLSTSPLEVQKLLM